MYRTNPSDEKLKNAIINIYNNGIRDISYSALKHHFDLRNMPNNAWKKGRSRIIDRSNFQLIPELGISMFFDTVYNEGVVVFKDLEADMRVMDNHLKDQKRKDKRTVQKLKKKASAAHSPESRRQLESLAKGVEEAAQARAARALMENIIDRDQFNQLMLGE